MAADFSKATYDEAYGVHILTEYIFEYENPNSQSRGEIAKGVIEECAENILQIIGKNKLI